MRYLVFIFSLLIFSSCGTMDKVDRKVRRQDFYNRFSKTELRASSGWKMGDDILILRKNKTFRYYSKVLGIANSGYYSGSYKKFNDSISFSFFENHKPSLFIKSDTLVFDTKDEWKVLRNSKTELMNSNYLVVYDKDENKAAHNNEYN
ncbi:hypothetical protein [uncultured Winogradskyella sp.]|uniref:hypothetical protein n=1 Tax=uncultured Winogradskyella sp. TaxID=395353 RepID=UPI002620FC73|nr:hypothetical protein [uncultured Winogradskyella sp.]|tara:strand:+ start:117 stop:560 length:444 start_codon:yes stop_codon:yes gene_type:complete